MHRQTFDNKLAIGGDDGSETLVLFFIASEGFRCFLSLRATPQPPVESNHQAIAEADCLRPQAATTLMSAR
jgi:hypothetical protein